MKAKVFRDLPQHTIVDVGWLDIMEDSTGDPRTSYVVLRHTLGRVWGVKRKDGVELLTLTFTVDPDGPEQSGWICIPITLIKDMSVVLRPEPEPGVQGGQE